MMQLPKIAYIELDSSPASDYLVLKGELPVEKEKIDIYWYENDVTPEEFAGEIEDLLEFYNTVIVATPLPEQFIKEIEKIWK